MAGTLNNSPLRPSFFVAALVAVSFLWLAYSQGQRSVLVSNNNTPSETVQGSRLVPHSCPKPPECPVCPACHACPPPPPPHVEKPAPEPPSWYELAAAAGTDKVNFHHYENLYEQYLPRLRNQHVKFLEIGLGCGMGPGKSHKLWREYFPDIDLYFIEFEKICLEELLGNNTHMRSEATFYNGDQADPVFLEHVIQKSGGNFDVVVDDGGHTMQQQMVSFAHLFPAVKPGGVYIIEDLHTSYLPPYHGDPDAVANHTNTTMEMIKLRLDNLHPASNTPRLPSADDILRIDCFAEICAFTKATI
ncbi:hypothetical protein HK104_001648 [Borealophlyctis nickersoniae]|nr:hypothetical protein HK104_001648 [Borealophlyctis nickersoniae]